MSEGLFRFCPVCATPLEYRTIGAKERAACPACGWIHFLDPKVAVTVLVIQDGKVLLVRRVFEPNKGYWSLPGGFVDAFEDPLCAAERECLEETSLRVKVSGPVGIFSGREHPRGADLVLVYQGMVTDGDLQPGDDADAACFFALDELPPLAFESTRKVLGRLSLQTPGGIVLFD